MFSSLIVSFVNSKYRNRLVSTRFYRKPESKKKTSFAVTKIKLQKSWICKFCINYWCFERHKKSPKGLVIIFYMKIFTVWSSWRTQLNLFWFDVNSNLYFLSSDFYMLKILIIESRALFGLSLIYFFATKSYSPSWYTPSSSPEKSP